MSFATLGGVRVTRADIVLPYLGIWVADIQLDSDASIPDNGIPLVFGTLTMVCAKRRGGVYAGNRAVRVYGGAGGWRKRLPGRYYQLASGITLKLVASDAAAECGEAVKVQTDRVVGPAYTRIEAAAARVLNDLAPSWFVAPDGTTTVGARVATPIKSPFVVVNFDTVHGIAEISTDLPQDWTPGRIFQIGTEAHTLRGVRHVIDADKVRTIASVE